MFVNLGQAQIKEKLAGPQHPDLPDIIGLLADVRQIL